jgi:transcription elongation GreA/GreB family factor
MIKRKIHFSPISEALVGKEEGEDLHFRHAEQQDEIVDVA